MWGSSLNGVRVPFCLIHWCAPWYLCGIQHKAGVDKSSRSPLNAASLAHKSLSIENFFNGLTAMLFPFICSWPSAIFPLLTGHRLVFILTADEVQLSPGCAHELGAADGRVWCSHSQLIKSWKPGSSLIFRRQALVEPEFAFLPLGSVFNSRF